MRTLAVLGLAVLALAGGADASGGSFGFTASLAGAGKAHATFGATLTGTSLSWRLTFRGPAASAELAGTRLCAPCRSPGRGKLVLSAVQTQLLEHGKVTARLQAKSGVLAGKVQLLAVTGRGGSTGATSTKPAPSSGPAGSTWVATAVSLRGQNGNRFEFVCPPNASAGAGPVWGGGTEYFTDVSAVCPAAVMTGDILLQGAGSS